ncbi:hypothetical protein pdam_00023822 [Pocillopora damicornis]|uniref:Apple domain-containing protein n=1 Tax=Pocillopora damicornis TaxID=46731 RepID=A0A3M6V4P3_POCDA|nr:hypothetical protein pdam_00023822 [Pocillopora damicornis]
MASSGTKQIQHKQRSMWWLFRHFRFVFLASTMEFFTANGQCRAEVNIQGMTLKRSVFKRWSLAAPHLCDVKCGQEITCQSYNYNRKYQICELNNRSKEARPENFLSAPAWSLAAPHLCDVKCGQEITCQSNNYNRKYKICELNNCTKEARPENFLSAPAWFYIRRLKGRPPLGSIPELPALSCHEIKASDGKHTISGKYWLDPTRKGKAKLIYCNMVNEVWISSSVDASLKLL